MRRFSICTACSVALAGVFAVACQDSPTATEQTQQVSGDVVTADTDGFAVGPVPPTSGPAVRFSVAASSGDVILPAAYATKVGELNNVFPHSFANMRYQQVFLGSEIGGPQTFRELCLRPDDVFGSGALVQQITLKLGPTNLDHTNLGMSFDANYSAPTTTVFAGNFNMPATGPGGVNDWKACMQFSTPFNYSGGNLIVEIINTSLVPRSPPFWVADLCIGLPDCTTARFWALSASASTATIGGRNQGLVMKLSPGLLLVEIDIKPGSDPNCFNNDGNGVIPVAILGAADLDVTQVDPSTVQLEGLSVASKGKSGKLMAHVEDVNGDGIDDLVVQIEDVAGTFTSGSGTATLTGNLFDGTPFEGSDDICVVPPAPPPPPPPSPDEEAPTISGLQPPDETPLFVWNPDLGVDYTAGSPAVIDLTRTCPSTDTVLCESLMFEAVDLGTGVEDGSCTVECADDDLDGNLIDVVILDSPGDAYNGTSLFTNSNGLGTDMFQAVFCEGGPGGPLCGGQDDGAYTVRVLVSDQASPQNNVATVDYPFVLDTKPPIIGFAGISGLNSSNAATVEFVLTANVVDRNGDGTALTMVTVDVSIEDITNGGADGDCTTLGDQLFTEADVLVSPNSDVSGLTVSVDVTTQVNLNNGDFTVTFTADNQGGNLGLGDYTYCFLITAEDGAERKDGTDISAVAGDITSVAGKDFNWQ